MKKVITYGTFDLFHEGHQNILARSKELGDYLIVGVTSKGYDESRGKLNVQEDLMTRIENVKNSGFADEVIIEDYEGQKISDILKYDIDIFSIGSDWTGKFDYLNQYCEVVYLERTRGISSTQLRNNNNGIVKIGVIGYGNIANRFIKESKYISGANVEGVFGLNLDKLSRFSQKHELNFYTNNIDEFFDNVDAVYIASPHLTHYDYIKKSLKNRKHVICEKPMALNVDEIKEVYEMAQNNKLVLLEAIKTAYIPAFNRLVSIARSGRIGRIKSVEATFTKLLSGDIRELDINAAGGSVTELASYPLLAVSKLLGTNYKSVDFISYMDKQKEVDIFTKINVLYKDSVATLKVGLGVKSEGDLIISGTKGYIYVHAPWWKTEFFEIKYEDSSYNEKFFLKFQGEGLRYELAEFIDMINKKKYSSYKCTCYDSMFISNLIQKYLDGENIKEID